MATFKEVDQAATDASIYSKDLPTLIQYRQELDRLASSSGDRLWLKRWEALHKLVCDLIQKLEAAEAETKRVAFQKELHRASVADSDKKHHEQIAESRYANRLSVLAIAVAVVAVAIAILGWRFPRAPHEPNQTQSALEQIIATPATNTTNLVVQPATTETPTNKTMPQK